MLMLIASSTALWPPAQADWPVGKKIKLAVVLEARSNRQSIADDFDASVRISSIDNVGIDPGITFTRGISLQVSAIDGIPVSPVFPPAGSPPSPPIIDTNNLTMVGHEQPMLVTLKESSRTIFPGAGRYRVRAIVSVFDWRHKPMRYEQFTSPPILIDISDS
jgi:hypothetical protein